MNSGLLLAPFFFSLTAGVFASSTALEEPVQIESVSLPIVLEEVPPPAADSSSVAAARDPLLGNFPKEGYTINYKTLSIVEYIGFASKMWIINCRFDEADLIHRIYFGNE